MENDRSPRSESYLKAFKPMKLGILEIKEGQGDLTLQATKIPGDQALEFRLLMLKKTKERKDFQGARFYSEWEEGSSHLDVPCSRRAKRPVPVLDANLPR